MIDTGYIEVITRGGKIGLSAQIDHPSLQLSENETGIFFLKTNQAKQLSKGQSKHLRYQPMTGPQGFIKYDLLEGKAKDPFRVYENVSTQLYRAIEDKLGKTYTEISSFTLEQTIQDGDRNALTSFSPTTTTYFRQLS